MTSPNLEEDLCAYTLNDLAFFIGTIGATATAFFASIFAGIRRSRCTKISCFCIHCLREIPDEIEDDASSQNTSCNNISIFTSKKNNNDNIQKFNMRNTF